jgi:tRNA (uracil-5-)-methyltransferase
MTNTHTEQDYQAQLDAKHAILTSLLSPFTDGDILQHAFIAPSSPSHYRMRAEFRVWHEGEDLYHIMFDKTSKQQYRVDQFAPASRLINRAMTDVIAHIKAQPILRHKLFQIDYLSCTTDEVVVSLLYHRQLDDEWQVAIEALRATLSQFYKIDFIGRARKQKRICERDYVMEALTIHDKIYTFKHIENSFTQPNALVNCQMIEWAADIGRELSGDLLELYCGAGNFSIPLADYFDNVLATEISKTSVAAAQENIQANDLNNCTILRMSSEEFVSAIKGEREFRRLADIDLTQYQLNTVLVDPPRAGLDDDTCEMISEYNNIIYISCNPHTLADNLKVLSRTHDVKQVALFDQFPFTEHMEAGVLLQRR